MRLSVKILGGEGCDVSVDPQDSVEFLKREIEVKLKLDKHSEQKLLFKGKALQDGTSLSDYHLIDGSKLNLVVKRREEPKPSPSSSGGANSEARAANSASPSAATGASSKTPRSSTGFGGFSNRFLLPSAKQPGSAASSPSTPSVEQELYNSIRKHFSSDADTRKVVDCFFRIHNDRLASLSLDDLERITAHYNETKTLKF